MFLITITILSLIGLYLCHHSLIYIYKKEKEDKEKEAEKLRIIVYKMDKNKELSPDQRNDVQNIITHTETNYSGVL